VLVTVNRLEVVGRVVPLFLMQWGCTWVRVRVLLASLTGWQETGFTVRFRRFLNGTG